jgi:hypothetical protein
VLVVLSADSVVVGPADVVVLGGGVTWVMPPTGSGVMEPVAAVAVVVELDSVVELDAAAVDEVVLGAVVAVVVVLGSAGSAVTAEGMAPTDTQPMVAATSAHSGRRRGMTAAG